MNTTTSFKTLIIAGFLMMAANAAAQDEELLKLRVPLNKTADNDIFGFNNDVEIDGTAEQNVAALSGSVVVKGTVKGNISVLGGSVTVDGGRVEGSVVCIGGSVVTSNGGSIQGKQINLLRGSPDPTAALPTAKSRISFYFAQSLFLYLLIVITFYIFPNQINEAAFDLSQDQVKPAVMGVATMASVTLIMLVSFLLMVVGIGFLIFLLLFCGMMVVTVFGLVVVYYRMGQYIEARTKNFVPEFIGVLIAVLATGLLLYVPIVGSLTAAAITVFAVGIVMATRFGTNKQWFTRKARYWAA
ncbi:MAG: polymer-forming cytoskeletal protein [Acidobacteriota bacterium]|nr:polymer-forming cytoskeletal protein [Acidobacteriota bacterium]